MWQNWLSNLRKYHLIAVIRSPKRQLGEKMAMAMAEGGVKFLEITWNSEQPAQLIRSLRAKLPDCYIGVGTIINQANFHLALDAGIQFAFSPHFDVQLLTLAHRHQIPFIPGTMSPTEIIHAFQAGASAVKVFPIQPLGGIEYLKTIKAPLTQIPLIPTGGIKLSQAEAFIQAGAIAVGLSSDLFPPNLIEEQKWNLISQRVAKVQEKLINYQPNQ